MGAEAERAVGLMKEISAGMRGCALLDADGTALAASGELDLWGSAASRLIGAADAARDSAPAEQVHVATEDGEVYALRHAGLTMVAVTDRFTLAALVVSDIRMILRDLAAGEVRDRRAPERGEVPVARESDEEIQADPEAATPPAA